MCRPTSLRSISVSSGLRVSSVTGTDSRPTSGCGRGRKNRFNPEWMGAVVEAFDEVAAKPEPRALVTSAGGKIWSNGLDLDWLGQNQDQVQSFVDQVHELLAKFLAAPMPTVAAIQGHCFAAGAMLALAHDWRLMRADRGFFCLPEADINIPFTPGMSAL